MNGSIAPTDGDSTAARRIIRRRPIEESLAGLVNPIVPRETTPPVVLVAPADPPAPLHPALLTEPLPVMVIEPPKAYSSRDLAACTLILEDSDTIPKLNRMLEVATNLSEDEETNVELRVMAMRAGALLAESKTKLVGQTMQLVKERTPEAVKPKKKSRPPMMPVQVIAQPGSNVTVGGGDTANTGQKTLPPAKDI